MTAKGKGSAANSVAGELAGELKHLRALVREVGENFILRREGEIEAIISQLAAIPAGSLKAEAPLWLRDIRKIKLKPGKGRIRDIKELVGVIEGLTEQVLSKQKKTKG